MPRTDTLRRLMSPELPETIDPMRLVKMGKEISGSYDLGQFDRVNASLKDSLLEDHFWIQVSFKLEFSRGDENRLSIIAGSLETTLPQVCQRCMQPMQYQLTALVNMAIVSNDAGAENLSADFESYYLDAGVSVKLQDLIEDELLLAMPLVSLHDEQVCPAGNKFRHEPKFELGNMTRKNPFAELKNLKLGN